MSKPRKYNPSTDRQILDDVCRSTNNPSLAAVYAAFLKHNIEWPVLNPTFGKPTRYADQVDDEICLAWVRRGWLKAA